MLRASILFFVLAFSALALAVLEGWSIWDASGLTFEAGRVGFFIFLGLSILTFGMALNTRRHLKRRIL